MEWLNRLKMHFNFPLCKIGGETRDAVDRQATKLCPTRHVAKAKIGLLRQKLSKIESEIRPNNKGVKVLG